MKKSEHSFQPFVLVAQEFLETSHSHGWRWLVFNQCLMNHGWCIHASALHIEGAPPITSSCPGAQAAAPAVVLAVTSFLGMCLICLGTVLGLVLDRFQRFVGKNSHPKLEKHSWNGEIFGDVAREKHGDVAMEKIGTSGRELRKLGRRQPSTGVAPQLTAMGSLRPESEAQATHCYDHINLIAEQWLRYLRYTSIITATWPLRSLGPQHTQHTWSKQLARAATQQLLFSLSLESHLNSATKVGICWCHRIHPADLRPGGCRMAQTLVGLPVLPSHDPLGVSNSPFPHNFYLFHWQFQKDPKSISKREVEKSVAEPPTSLLYFTMYADLVVVPFSSVFYLLGNTSKSYLFQNE